MVNISVLLSIYLGVCAALIKSCLASCMKGCVARSPEADVTLWPASLAVRFEGVGSSSLVLTNQEQRIIAELHFNPINTSSLNDGDQPLYRIHSQQSSHLFVIPLDTWLILRVRRRQENLQFELEEPLKSSGVSSSFTISSSVNADITAKTTMSFSSGNIVMDGKCLKEKYHRHHHKDGEHHSHSMEETDAMPVSGEDINSSETAVNESDEGLSVPMPYVVIISVCICSTLIVVVCVLVGVHHCQKRMLHRRKCLFQHQIIKRQQEEYKQQDVLLESNQESLLQITSIKSTNETNRENMPKTHSQSPCSFDCSISDSINKLNWKRSKLSRQSSNVSKRLSEESNATTSTNLEDSSCTINRIYSNLRPDHLCIHKNSITNIPWYPTVEDQRSHMATDFRKQSLIRQQSCPPIEVHK